MLESPYRVAEQRWEGPRHMFGGQKGQRRAELLAGGQQLLLLQCHAGQGSGHCCIQCLRSSPHNLLLSWQHVGAPARCVQVPVGTWGALAS